MVANTIRSFKTIKLGNCRWSETIEQTLEIPLFSRKIIKILIKNGGYDNAIKLREYSLENANYLNRKTASEIF